MPLVHKGGNMRYFACLLVALCLSASVTRAQEQPKLSSAQREVVDAQKARAEAGDRREEVAWSRYVADDCIFSGDNGARTTKAQSIELLKKKLPLEYDHSVNQRDYVVHIYRNTAVINYRVTAHERFADTDIITEQRDTDTDIKQNGARLLVARQWVNVPVNLRRPVAIDTSVYKDCVGQYEWRPLDDVETISMRDGRLWTQSGKDLDEYFPLGADSFFIKAELGIATFSCDAQGHVTGYTCHLPDGQEIHVKKIK
jgi:hypothetical protein